MLDWQGDNLTRKIKKATKKSIDKTMSLCVREAKRTVPVRTATLQGSIEMREAREEGYRMVGLWGSFLVEYALWVEVGTYKMTERPYMQPAADQYYPGLAEMIRKAI